MQDLDSFVSPIPSFEDDVPIPAIPISASDPGAEPSEEAPTGSSASTLWTRASKQKVHINPNPLKQAKKIVGKPLGGIKITGPKPKAPA
jgi:hypothetical protein